MPTDYEFVSALEHADGYLQQYRQRAITAPPEHFAGSLWGGVLVQFIAESLHSDSSPYPIGVAVAYNADHRNGHARFATLVRPELLGCGWPLEATELLVDYLFLNFPFRKLYADSLGPNLSQYLSAASSLFAVEGRLVDHEFLGGEYVDLVTLALYRETWQVRRESTRVNQDGLTGPIDLGDIERRLRDTLGVDLSARYASVDSLMLYEIVAILESTLDVRIPDEKLRGVVCAEDVNRLILEMYSSQ